MSFFREIWILTSKLKLPPDYIDTISPVEREVFMSIYSDEKARMDQSNQNGDNNVMNIGSPIDPY